MKTLKGLRPSPALVIACLALFVALGGVGYSAVKLKANSVKSKAIKSNAVTAPKIASGAVTSGKIADNAVTSNKIASGAVTSGKVFFATSTTLNFGTILAEACDARDVSAPGIQATDHIVVTPPPGFPITFTLQGIPGNGVVSVAACNTFTAGGVDPDGPGGGPYKVLVIR
jgi:hypothetical protein